MTDNDESAALEELRHHVFGPPNPNPIDPTGRITLAEVEAFSQNWQHSRGRTDADISTDTDGFPTGVGESQTTTCAGLAIWQADADRLGITDGQYPGILIIPTPKKKGTNP